MSDLAAVLDPIRERAAEVNAPCGNSAAFINRLYASAKDVPRLLAVADAVLAEHRPIDRGRVMHCCYSCESDNEDFHEDCCHEWPCPTYEAVSAALLGTEADQ